ncbi:LysR family transcriptional regulator [Pseudoroseicyclus aestuarii]|uniref:DNA-binding transcriptional LysR family regulator n=1 Tax=Pseudoroseicyclus aestuarii TaxID=1795041 RepID=A0A318T5I8_9RHOB|nr:LysR family transcriptional regulator [Pseudoroseicyclus aestuarii]PYE85654.1 DNA-binding transcriptional LysR family regulator [Pseudoroseicyclus aestuarii]
MNRMTLPEPPLLDLDLLRSLIAIAERGSFSAAAEVVHRTPSAISMQVKKMEDLLGRPLFLRDSRSVALTEDGRALLEHARRMLALNREALARFVSPDLAGTVRLGAPDHVAASVLPDLLRRFGDSHPGVTVDVSVGLTRRLRQQLRQGLSVLSLDLALFTVDCDGGETTVVDAELELLWKEPLVWGIARSGVAAERHPLPVAAWDESCSWASAGFAALQAQGRDYRIAFKSAHTVCQLAALRADLAVAPVPLSQLGEGVVEAPASAGLPPLPDTGLALAVALDAAPPVRAAADHLRAAFSARG